MYGGLGGIGAGAGGSTRGASASSSSSATGAVAKKSRFRRTDNLDDDGEAISLVDEDQEYADDGAESAEDEEFANRHFR